MAMSCLSFGPAILGIIGLLFGVTGGLWCRLVKVSPNYSYSPPPDYTTPSWIYLLPDAEFGLYFRRTLNFQGVAIGNNNDLYIGYKDDCSAYTSGLWDSADATWRAVMILEGISWIVAFALSMSLFVSMCCSFSRRAYVGIGITWLVIPFLFQALVFLVWTSNLCKNNPQFSSDQFLNAFGTSDVYQKGCTMSKGSVLCIIATVIYMLTGILCFCLGEKPAKTEVVASEAADEEEQQPAAPAEEEEKVEEAEKEGDEEGEKQEEEKDEAEQEELAEDTAPVTEETEAADAGGGASAQVEEKAEEGIEVSAPASF